MNSRRLYRRLNDIFSKISEEDYPEIYNIIENDGGEKLCVQQQPTKPRIFISAERLITSALTGTK